MAGPYRLAGQLFVISGIGFRQSLFSWDLSGYFSTASMKAGMISLQILTLSIDCEINIEDPEVAVLSSRSPLHHPISRCSIESGDDFHSISSPGKVK